MSVNPSQLKSEGGSIINALSDAQIVRFEIVGGMLHVEECCDGYFGAFLSNLQLEKLIEELKALHDQI